MGLALIAASYMFLQRRTVKIPDPLSAIGQDVSIVFYSNKASGIINKFLHENNFWEAFSTTSQLSEFHKNLSFIDSLAKNDELINKWLVYNKIYVALFPTPRNETASLAIIQAGSSRKMRQITKKIISLAGNYANISTRKVKGVKITDIEFLERTGLGSFSFTFSDGLFLFSENRSLLETSIELMNSQNSIINNEIFRQVYATAGKNVDANIFINFKNFSPLISPGIASNKAPVLALISRLSDWGGMDLHIRNDGVVFNGFSYSKSTDVSYLNVFLKQEPVLTSIDRIIPSEASAFIQLGLSNTDVFKSNYLDYLSLDGRLENYYSNIDQIDQQYNIDFESIFYELMAGEIAAVFYDSGNEEGENYSYLIFTTKSQSLAQAGLNEIIQGAYKNTDSDERNYKTVYRIDDQTSFDIYKMPINYVGEILFGDLFAGIETAYFTFIDNYLVFGNNIDALSFFLRENALNKTLQTDITYRSFSEHFSAKSNIFFFLNPSRAEKLLSSFLKGESLGIISKDFATFRSIQAVALQFSSGKNMIYQNLYAGYWPVPENVPETTWKTMLEAPVTSKPFLVKNHITGENEIFVQDVLNNIYLINRSGRVIWKKQLPEPILSEIFQIDFYKNRKLQLLFNTANFIYLIDRNGNFVENYPIRLPSAATSGLAVFDYEGKLDYRLFIACIDRNIHAFTKEGVPVKGWEFKGTENLVRTQIQHVNIATRDYLIASDKFRIYILDRRGNSRVKVQGNFPKSEHNPVVFEPKTSRSEARLVSTDTSGNVWFVYFNGKVDSIQLGSFSPDHFFDYRDVDADGFGDFIFVDGNRLEVFRKNRSKLFSYQFVNQIELPPAYYHFGARDRRIGVVDSKDNQIYLFLNNGNIYRGFPLQGSSPFTIGYLKQPGGSFNLLVGSDSNLFFNYTIN